MSKSPKLPALQLISKLREELLALSEQAPNALRGRELKNLTSEIYHAVSDLSRVAGELDTVKSPGAAFDPGNPRTIAFFVALALSAQPRTPLESIRQFYGAGVYAIYYKGDFPLYLPISGSETPIYVGQASTSHAHARSPMEQGVRLAARLDEHRKNIARASDTLRIQDFDYRALVVQTGWETGAEDYLIRLFRPIWNSETKLIFGLGKHGDSASTRKNRRSPWDTLHVGRKWAVADEIEDAKSKSQIEQELVEHFRNVRVYPTFDSLLDEFRRSLQQA
ncbi:Eco29kI family restriction endonuclease [Dongia sp. agr-C8]